MGEKAPPMHQELNGFYIKKRTKRPIDSNTYSRPSQDIENK